jgi:type IV secretory pathway VirB9-like protein
MKKTFSALIVGAAWRSPSLALAAPGDDLADKYFNKTNPTLTAQERAALAIAKRWEAGSATGIKPVAGSGGAIKFVYGAQQPSIVCAVLQVCDVALQPGEQVNSINLGDTARWTVEPAITGSGATEVQHLIIKPMDVGLETSLVVTTNRRTYHFRLRSHRTEYMPQVSFTYPEEAQAKWDAIQRRESRNAPTTPCRRPASTWAISRSTMSVRVGELEACARLQRWPQDHHRNARHDAADRSADAPGRAQGGRLFTDDETVLVNYRVQGDRYIVDTVFDKAILIAGVGSSQDRVTITRRK